ncbi:tetratricopeptide repeat protein [Cohnella mopanensis]|uniref:tetratricopeptide repeat protein n=1 Tax=Cohnella mopanensis TaxID=2911966 RepID=UPI001EF8EA89|nr:tetratricopeptide repeat protein [Cohnella mopanensis]
MDGETCLRQAYEAIFQGDFESAVYWFGQAIEIEPENAAFHYSGSITCARSGKIPMAVAYAQRAIELDPDNPTYRLNLRMVMSRQKISDARHHLSMVSPDIELSIMLLKEAAHLDPLSAEARYMLGMLYRMQRDYKHALDSLRDALQLEPQHEDAKRMLHEVRAERRRLLKQQYSHYHSKRNR